MKIVLIDLFNLLIRNFCVIPTKDNTGENNGGLFGSLVSIKSFVKQFDCDKVVVVTDGKGGSYRRRKLFENYKDQRKVPRKLSKHDFDSLEDEKQSLRKQYYRLLEYINIFPFNFICVDYIEADDSISYITTLNKDDEYIIVSTDRDYLQLISNNVKVYSPTKKKLYDTNLFIEEYNCHPLNYGVVKSIIGDNSDNIPGISGIGIKTAISLFPFLKEEKQYSIDELQEYCNKQLESKQKKYYQQVLDNMEMVRLNYKLVQLYDVDIGLDLSERVKTLYNEPIKQITPFTLRLMFVQDQMFSQIKNINEWVTLLAKLSLRSNKIING